MKNYLNRYWIAMFLMICFLNGVVWFLIDVVHERDIEVVDFFFIILFTATFFTLFQRASIYYPLYKRISYLENSDCTKPSIKYTCSSETDIPQDFNFNRMKTLIGNQWIVTFSNDKEQVLKFRTKFTNIHNTWTAAWLKVDDDTGKIYFDCFPMANWQVSKYTKEMQKEVERCIC